MTELKKIILISFLFVLPFQIYAKKTRQKLQPQNQLQIKPPEELTMLMSCYPEFHYTAAYEKETDDWKVEIELLSDKSKIVLYWCNGKMLPPEELEQKDNYRQLLYAYPKELADPSTFTQEEKQKLKEAGSIKNRRESTGSSMFFFDAIYSANTRASLEQNIEKVTFLGKGTNVHKLIKEPLKKVEEQIFKLSETDDEVRDFVKKIKSADAYAWRLIDGTNRKSFHSYGIAVDIIPTRITGEIFWSWARDKNPEGWMLTPLKRRWLPPKKVVEIFEKEGFIWGGKWALWDNMHFEYHPELIKLNKITD